MKKVLVICGPTTTGKTAFGMEVAKKYNGEIISADSRQVYTGMDIVTGKDLPPGSKPIESNLKWRGRKLKYYSVDGINIWLYDIISPDEPFNVAFWNEAASLVISDIQSRGKTPVVVGGTGLYIKSLSGNLTLISNPPNPGLRDRLSDKPVNYLFNYLNRLDPAKSASLNVSDKHNPRRLIRAVEIVLAGNKQYLSNKSGKGTDKNYLQIGLIAPVLFLKEKIDKRITDRMINGALTEVKALVNRYGWDLPSMTACGYRAFKSDNFLNKWKISEGQYIRRQFTWFKKQPDIHWFDISSGNWQIRAMNLVATWYNKNSQKKDHAQKD